MEDESIWQQEWTKDKSKLYPLRKDKGRYQQIEENDKKMRDGFQEMTKLLVKYTAKVELLKVNHWRDLIEAVRFTEDRLNWNLLQTG